MGEHASQSTPLLRVKTASPPPRAEHQAHRALAARRHRLLPHREGPRVVVVAEAHKRHAVARNLLKGEERGGMLLVVVR